MASSTFFRNVRYLGIFFLLLAVCSCGGKYEKVTAGNVTVQYNATVVKKEQAQATAAFLQQHPDFQVTEALLITETKIITLYTMGEPTPDEQFVGDPVTQRLADELRASVFKGEKCCVRKVQTFDEVPATKATVYCGRD